MMVAPTSRTGFFAGAIRSPHFDLVEVSTIAIGIVVITALTMMF